MDPKWVLSNDQKRIRFRNHNKRKSDKAKTLQSHLATTQQLKDNLATLQSPLDSTIKRLKTQIVDGFENEQVSTSLKRYKTCHFKARWVPND